MKTAAHKSLVEQELSIAKQCNFRLEKLPVDAHEAVLKILERSLRDRLSRPVPSSRPPTEANVGSDLES